MQKQAKQLNCDVNSEQFKNAMKYLWIPRLLERIRAAADVSKGVDVYQPPETSSSEYEKTSECWGEDGFFSETLMSPIIGGFNEGFTELEEISLVAAGEDCFQSENLWSFDDFLVLH